LKPGVSLEQAQARLKLSAADYKQKYPNALGPNQTFSVMLFREVLVRNVKTLLFVMAGAVSFVLLIACANVANLLLARATGRRREIAIRAAIGGSRGRIIRQLLTESVVLSTAGGIFGLLFGMVGIRALLAISTAGLPRVGEDGAAVGLDWRVLGFTIAVAVGTGILFGLIPALQSSTVDLERLRAIPGVANASATCCVPLQGGYGLPFKIVGRKSDGPFDGGGSWMTVSPGYFEIFKIPVKQGRSFIERDDSHGQPVVVINEAMARQYWPKASPLGEHLIIGRGVMREFADEPERQIIGVVGDSRDGGLNSDPGPKMFIPQAQVPDLANALNVRLTPMAWVVRTQMEPHTLSSAIQEQLRQATGLPVTDVRSMGEVVSLSTARERFNMWLMTVFGVSALLLAAIGVYGLMAYSVEQRTQEIGIRLALGAQAAQVKNMVVLQGMRLAIFGVVIGVAAGFGLARFIETFLYGVTKRDPLVFVGVPILLSIVALLAVWIPARRASHVDPIIALRYE